MFRIYLLVFDGYLNVHFQNLNGKENGSFYSISLWGKEGNKILKNKIHLLALLTINNTERTSFFQKKTYPHRINRNVKSITRRFIDITYFFCTKKNACFYPYESDNTMLFSMLGLVLFTLFVGAVGISFSQEVIHLDILYKLLIPCIDLLHQDSKNYVDWYEFFTNATLSVGLAFLGIVIAYSFYKPIYSALQNLNLLNLFEKIVPKKIIADKIKNIIYDWSDNRGYIDTFYGISFIASVRKLAKLNHSFDRQGIDGIPNGVGITSFFIGEVVKSVGGGRISSYILLIFLFVLIFLVICYFLFD